MNKKACNGNTECVMTRILYVDFHTRGSSFFDMSVAVFGLKLVGLYFRGFIGQKLSFLSIAAIPPS